MSTNSAAERTHRLSGVEAAQGTAALPVFVNHAALHVERNARRAIARGLPHVGHAGIGFTLVLGNFIIIFVHHEDTGNPARLNQDSQRNFISSIYVPLAQLLPLSRGHATIASSQRPGRLMHQFPVLSQNTEVSMNGRGLMHAYLRAPVRDDECNTDTGRTDETRRTYTAPPTDDIQQHIEPNRSRLLNYTNSLIPPGPFSVRAIRMLLDAHTGERLTVAADPQSMLFSHHRHRENQPGLERFSHRSPITVRHLLRACDRGTRGTRTIRRSASAEAAGRPRTRILFGVSGTSDCHLHSLSFHFPANAPHGAGCTAPLGGIVRNMLRDSGVDLCRTISDQCGSAMEGRTRYGLRKPPGTSCHHRPAKHVSHE